MEQGSGKKRKLEEGELPTSIATEAALQHLKAEFVKQLAQTLDICPPAKKQTFFMDSNGNAGGVLYDPKVMVEEQAGGCEKIIRYRNGIPYECATWNALGQRHGPTILYSGDDLQQVLWKSEYCNGTLHGKVFAYKKALASTLKCLNLGQLLEQAISERIGASLTSLTDIRLDGTWNAGFPATVAMYLPCNEKWEVDFLDNKLHIIKVFRAGKKTHELGFLNDRLEGV